MWKYKTFIWSWVHSNDHIKKDSVEWNNENFKWMFYNRYLILSANAMNERVQRARETTGGRVWTPHSTCIVQKSNLWNILKCEIVNQDFSGSDLRFRFRLQKLWMKNKNASVLGGCEFGLGRGTGSNRAGDVWWWWWWSEIGFAVRSSDFQKDVNQGLIVKSQK